MIPKLKPEVLQKIRSEARNAGYKEVGRSVVASVYYELGATPWAIQAEMLAEALEYYRKYNYLNEPDDVRCVADQALEKYKEFLK